MWLRSFLGVLGAYHLIALPCVLALGPIVADRELDGASSWAVIGIGSIIGAAIGLRAGPRRPMVACAVAFVGAACQPANIAGAGSTRAIVATLAIASQLLPDIRSFERGATRTSGRLPPLCDPPHEWRRLRT